LPAIPMVARHFPWICQCLGGIQAILKRKLKNIRWLVGYPIIPMKCIHIK
jgi:hypothetical protein